MRNTSHTLAFFSELTVEAKQGENPLLSLHLRAHDVAVGLFLFTMTSSYCCCVSNPSVMLLLSSNLGNTTAM